MYLACLMFVMVLFVGLCVGAMFFQLPCKPPRYRWHLGCILLKMPVINDIDMPVITISMISLSAGWLGGTSYTHSKRATQPILTPKSAWVLFLGWVLCNVVIVLSESGNADECGVTLQRHSTAAD